MEILKYDLPKSECNHKNVFEKSYLDFQKWAQEKIDNKEKQTQCQNCGLWFFKDEF